MRFFFRSPQFKKILAVFLALVTIATVLGIIGGTASPGSSILGAVVTPIQKMFTSVSNNLKDRKTALQNGRELMDQNEQLQAEVDRLTEELLQAQEAVRQNEFYKEFLELKEHNPDFQMEPATKIDGDNLDPYRGFIIDKGSINGIAQYDPVITASGLIGYVSEVSLSYSKVTTLLSADMKVGGMDKRTADVGVISGSYELARQGFCRIYNLPRTSSVTLGDYIVTSGGGIFPSGLLIGKIEQVRAEENNTSIYAIVKPSVDMSDIREVMVLTYFSGHGTAVYTPEGN